ncbi:MAG: glycosyltransferase [Pseudomonadota bacterium]
MRFLVSRVIKLFATLIKVLCLVHIRVFPKARFSIPTFAPALIRSKSARKIPRQVFQISYDQKVSLAIYIEWLFNRLMAADHDFHLHIDKTSARDWINDTYPSEIADTFNRLQIGAAQADYWRILVLLKNGGIYLDTDANFVWPPSWSIPNDADEFFIQMRDGEVTNYFLAAAPGNRFFTEIERLVRQNIHANTHDNIYEMTGPRAMQPALEKGGYTSGSFRTIAHHGQFTNERLQYPDRHKKKWWREQEDKSILR